VCIFPISSFSLFLTIFQVLQCVFLILHVFQCFLPYFMPYHVSFSFSSFVSYLPYSRSYHDFLIFLICQFSRYIQVPTVCVFHFALFSVFLATCNVLPCDFRIFLVCKFSRHTPYPTVCISHFPRFSVFFGHIPDPKECVYLFTLFSVFLPYCMSYCVHFSFSTFLSVSHHIPGQTVFVSHFPRFSVY
jgi:hypothetical protein